MPDCREHAFHLMLPPFVQHEFHSDEAVAALQETCTCRCRRPVVEFNARFTMGIVSLGVLRRLLRGQKTQLAVSPGELRRFVLLYNAGEAPARPDWPAYSVAIEPGLRLAIELQHS